MQHNPNNTFARTNDLHICSDFKTKPCAGCLLMGGHEVIMLHSLRSGEGNLAHISGGDGDSTMLCNFGCIHLLCAVG